MVDPAGSSLTTTTTYETPGAGYLRPIARSLPKGPSSQTTTTYYGDTETRARLTQVS